MLALQFSLLLIPQIALGAPIAEPEAGILDFAGNAVNQAVSGLGEAKDWVEEKGGDALTKVEGLGKNIASSAVGAWDHVKDGFNGNHAATTIQSVSSIPTGSLGTAYPEDFAADPTGIPEVPDGTVPLAGPTQVIHQGLPRNSAEPVEPIE